MGWVSGKESQREREKRETENVVNAIITKVMEEMCFVCLLPCMAEYPRFQVGLERKVMFARRNKIFQYGVNSQRDRSSMKGNEKAPGILSDLHIRLLYFE